MASTLNLFANLKGVIGVQKVDFPPDGLFAPRTVTTTADILLQERVVVPTSDVTELISVGADADIESAVYFIFIPSGACRITWRGSGSDADNSAVVCQANGVLVIPGYQTLPYQTTSSNRIDETAAAISSFSCWQNTGSNINVDLICVG